MKTDSRIQKWITWLGVIESEMYELLMLRYVFWEVQKIIKANPKIQMDGYFYEWLGLSYSKTACIGVRRQLDPDPRGITLARLLAEIQQSSIALTYSRFESMYTDGQPKHTQHQKMLYDLQKQQAQRDFKQFGSRRKGHVDASFVCNDLIRLNMACDSILRYAHKRIAHRDKKKFTQFPTFNDLDKAIDLLFTVYKKYVHLLRGVQYDITIAPQWDWKEVFTVPWINEP
ncbi:MAG: hypothetical protein HYR76_05575 [Ignavibacteria bacterium]|nr:hypothetical protein [Ignavibacteria bacterium]